MVQEKINRINELAKKAKTVGLTEKEKEEQKALRLEYVAEFRQSLTAQLENTYIVDEHGNKTKVKKKEN